MRRSVRWTMPEDGKSVQDIFRLLPYLEGMALLQADAVPQALGAAISGRLVEPLDPASAIRLDHALRRDVRDVGRQLHIWQPFSKRFGEDVRQRLRGVAEP